MATHRTTLSHSTKITTWVVAILTLVIIGRKMASPRKAPESGPDFAEFGRIPVLKSGRIKPLDTLARNQLLAINGKGSLSGTDMEKMPTHASVKPGRLGKPDTWELDRNAWLAEVLFDGPSAASREVLLVENDNVKALFGKEGVHDKRFSPRTVLAAKEQINRLAAAAAKKPKERITTVDKQVTALSQRAHGFLDISAAIQPPGTKLYEQTLIDITRMVNEASASMQSVKLEGSDNEVANQLSDEQVLQINQVGALMTLMQELDFANDSLAMRPLPPLDAGADLTHWRKSGSAAIAPTRTQTEDEALIGWARISDGYRAIDQDNGESFNRAVSDYLAFVDGKQFVGTDKAQTEFWFNGVDPFMISMVIYIIAGLMVLAGWLIWREQFTTSAFWLIVIALAIHTVGIAMRIYLSGRPPVTNLYSSAVFVGWGGAAVALLLEKGVLRNGIGSFVAASLGVVSLVVALNLSFDGDTMEVKQAVLDSNFWLTTHVLIITLGYSACFLAGFLGLIYGIANMISPNILGKEGNRSLYASTYGIICFALLFSFIGTVLGGIWADQSWGRFWGWDPKENGALIIVLWNALILHARLGGICREPGFMALAILGIAITLWSWFGTNLLGVGLHSYGFREGALVALGWSCAAVAVIALLTVITHRKPTKAPAK